MAVRFKKSKNLFIEESSLSNRAGLKIAANAKTGKRKG
jgi:hypothetical protein